jgi:hypothetical protein
LRVILSKPVVVSVDTARVVSFDALLLLLEINKSGRERTYLTRWY